MEPLTISGTADTPQVTLNAKTNTFEILGESNMDDTGLFYSYILNWLDDYARNPNPKTRFEFKLNHFDTSSSRQIIEILQRLKAIHDDNNEVLVVWYYHIGDVDMLESGEDFATEVEVPFDFYVVD